MNQVLAYLLEYVGVGVIGLGVGTLNLEKAGAGFLLVIVARFVLFLIDLDKDDSTYAEQEEE